MIVRFSKIIVNHQQVYSNRNSNFITHTTTTTQIKMKGNLRCLICSIHNKVHSRSVVLIMLMVLMWFNPISSVEGIGIENSTIINNGYIKNFEANPKDVLKKPTFTTGNILWDHLIRDCLKKPSFTCLQKNMYSYLSDILTSHTVNATNNIQFSKNTVKYDEEEEEANSIYDNEINIDQNGKKNNVINLSYFTLSITFSFFF